jgi:hypothetical protein
MKEEDPVTRFVSPRRIGAFVLLAALAFGSTIGWVESAGGSQGGATLSVTTDNLYICVQIPQNVTLIFFVEGPGFYTQQERALTGYSGCGDVGTGAISVPSAQAGVYEIGVELEPTDGGGLSISGSPAVSSSLGGVVNASDLDGNNQTSGATDQAVSTFVYRNKLIPAA